MYPRCLAPKLPASPAAAHTPAAVMPPPMAMNAPLVLPPSVPPEHAATVQAFILMTNLRPEYAADCLAHAGWNIPNASKIFFDRKMANLLPVEAWLPGYVPR